MDIKLEDFHFDLPEDLIAKFPTSKRDKSKLLKYEAGEISHHSFEEITNQILSDSLLIFNDTKVIPARIILHKESGARIEIFLLEPVKPSTVHEEIMQSKVSCQWKCLIGNAKKWKVGTTLNHATLPLRATRVDDQEVQFEWEGDLVFSEILAEIGKIPLPPYMNREVEESDQERYQTVYSKIEGAVAAPTAGLHFTEEILGKLKRKGVSIEYLTLHVSAGTFQPIKAKSIYEHPMHNEQVIINRNTVEKLINQSRVIAVGTTSMRTLESLYWFGVKLGSGKSEFHILKDDPYTFEPQAKEQAMKNVLSYMDQNNLVQLLGQTEIFIYPGYQMRVCKGLVTNYHLPGSTLILLVAAFVGQDWKRIYQQAIENNYRFLSYGDSSLLLPK